MTTIRHSLCKVTVLNLFVFTDSMNFLFLGHGRESSVTVTGLSSQEVLNTLHTLSETRS